MSDHDPIQNLWTNQPSEEITMSLADIRARAGTLQSVVNRRNTREFAVGAILIVLFSVFAVIASTPLGQLGCALTAAGVAFVMWRMYAIARSDRGPGTAAVQGWLQFYRKELVRQRDALQSIWFWYLGPLVPGMVVYWLSVALKRDDIWGWIIAAAGLTLGATLFAWIASANKEAAKQLQAEIDALDAAAKS
jgi:hypothetical protein